jgi:hypothetical protein
VPENKKMSKRRRLENALQKLEVLELDLLERKGWGPNGEKIAEEAHYVGKQIEAITKTLAAMDVLPAAPRPSWYGPELWSKEWYENQRQFKLQMAREANALKMRNLPKTQYARKGKSAIKTAQQLRKEVAVKKWKADFERRQRIEKARIQKQAWKFRYEREKAIPKPQRKTFNVYLKKTQPKPQYMHFFNEDTGEYEWGVKMPRQTKYRKGMKCHGCGEFIDDCEC